MEKNKKIYIGILSLGIILLYGCGGQEMQDSAAQSEVLECQVEGGCDDVITGSLTAEGFKQKLESGEYELIDIRTHDEYMKERIADVPNIDIYEDDFNERIGYLDKGKKYLVYCRSGNRSKDALERMRMMGFAEIYDLDKGIKEWKKAGYETIGAK